MKHKWLKIGTLIALLLLVWLLYESYSKQPVSKHEINMLIGSGSRGGNYYKTGSFIAEIYTKTFKNYKFSSIATNGSKENIRRLRDNSIDLAIVQRNLLIDAIYDKEIGIKNLSIITPLFQEKLLIYTPHQGVELSQIKSLVKNDTLKIGITGKKSYSYEIFNQTIKLLNVDTPEIKWVVNNYSDLINDIQNNKIDALVTFSLEIPELEKNTAIHKLYLSEKNANILKSRFHKVSVTHIDNDTTKYSLGNWSFLVGKDYSIQFLQPQSKLIDVLLQNDSIPEYKDITRKIKQSIQKFEKNAHHEKNLLQILPLSDVLQKRMKISAGVRIYYYVFVAFLLVGLVIFLFKKRMLFFWRRYKHFQYGLFLIIAIYFLSIELLIYFERYFYLNGGGRSQILNMTRSDLHLWLLTTTITGNSGGIFPLTYYGKMMILLNSVNSWIGTIFIAFSEFMIYKMNNKRKQGLMKTKFKDHLIIFGWNRTAEKFVIEILNEAETYYKEKIKIVCVVSDIKEVREKYEKIRKLHDDKKIDIIQGDALHTHTLDMCNLTRAKTVILLSEDSSKISDEHTVMRAHAISRYARKKYKQIHNGNKDADKDVIYMIAEINNEEFKESLLDADVNEIVIAGNYRKAIMKQSLFNHGISKVIDEIMQYNEYNEFYKIDLAEPENKHLRNKTFDELHVALRKQGILLIGIHIIFKEDGKIIIDQEIIKEKLKEKEPNITRDVIVNPTDFYEIARKVDDNDHLIVLAISMKDLKERVKKVTFKNN